MRAASRSQVVYFLLLFVLMAYCSMQQHELDKPSSTQLRRNLQIFNRLGNYLDPKSTALREQGTHATKVSFVTSFWAKVKGEEVNPHRREVEAALLANIHNPHFDQVVVFLDRKDNAESCLDFYQAMSDLSRQVFSMTTEESNELLSAKVSCVDVQTGQPTYYQMFRNALSDVVTGDIVVLANADMAFDDSMSLARALHPEVLAVLATRGFSNKMPANIKSIYEEMMGTDYIANDVDRSGAWEVDRCPIARGISWDTWIFHKSKLMGRLKEEKFQRHILNNNLVYFNMNEMGAEHAALYAIEQSYPFSSVYNACDKIQSWHFHLTPKTHKAREIPWLQKTKNPRDPEFSPFGSVPKPWGGFYMKGVPHPYVRKDPDCVRTDSCFLPLM